MEITPDSEYQYNAEREHKEYVEATRKDVIKWCKESESIAADLDEFRFYELRDRLQTLRKDIAAVAEKL